MCHSAEDAALADPDRGVWPQIDCGRYPVKRSVGDARRRLGRHLPRRPRGARRRRPVQAPPARGGGRRRRSSDARARTAGPASFEVDALGRWCFAIEAWVDRFASWRREVERKVEAGQEDLAGELSEGAALFGVDVADRRGGARVDRARTAPSSRASQTFEVDCRPRSSRASASWYELFPRSWGGFKGVTACCRGSPSSASTSSTCRPSTRSATTNRKGRNNSLTAEPGDPGARGRSAARTAATRRSHPELGTLEDFDRIVARGAGARARDRARLRDPVLARPPVAARAPGVVPPPPGRDAEVRGEPAEALPGHLQRQLRLARTGAGSGRRSSTRHALGRARRPGLPRRQPAHEAGAVLGVADPRGAARSTPT